MATLLLKESALDLMDPSSSCPALKLFLLGEVIERAVAEQLQKSLDDTSALDPFQSGFRHSHGMEAALVALQHDLCSSRIEAELALLLLLDLTAASVLPTWSVMIFRCTASLMPENLGELYNGLPHFSRTMDRGGTKRQLVHEASTGMCQSKSSF